MALHTPAQPHLGNITFGLSRWSRQCYVSADVLTPLCTMSDKPAQKRKCEAAIDLRALASELQIVDRGRNADLNSTDFASLPSVGHISI